jgi:hypothetical protein
MKSGVKLIAFICIAGIAGCSTCQSRALSKRAFASYWAGDGQAGYR